ncbi:DUF2889 domain-containing protein [Pseudomonas lopnurensis]|uniref:DUF2889 domain-containing protein n=1 Tax=Pseudomonas lopnurensis TaxID=1477517 RepID=UPI0028AE8FA7|nr:DUF2889 domain-containing protein [Pseudomonas lopnurensis]
MANGFPRTGGRLRRLIDLRHESPHLVVAWVEDDFHHFGVSLEHHDGIVSDIRMAAPRAPWTTCAGAAEPLRELIGKPLQRRASDIGQLLDMRQQCTHVFDLSGLAMAHAAQQRPDRRYQAIVPDREVLAWDGPFPRLGPTSASLLCNGQQVMFWQIAQGHITGPAPYSGQSLEAGFRAWTETLDEDLAEYATILRRAQLVAGGRAIDHDQWKSAGSYVSTPLCYSFQPERSLQAKRNVGSTWDYVRSAQGMLINVREVP